MNARAAKDNAKAALLNYAAMPVATRQNDILPFGKRVKRVPQNDPV